jgi:hypothetical protein
MQVKLVTRTWDDKPENKCLGIKTPFTSELGNEVWAYYNPNNKKWEENASDCWFKEEDLQKNFLEVALQLELLSDFQSDL